VRSTLAITLTLAACGSGGTNRHSAASGPPPKGQGEVATPGGVTATKPSCFNIVNGVATDQYPAVGLVLGTRAGAMVESCTGSFIAGNLMLTAAHCALSGADTAIYWIPGASVALPRNAADTAALIAKGKKVQSVVTDATDLATGGVNTQSISKDAAVLVFDGNVAPATLDLATGVADGAPVTLVGYGDLALIDPGDPVVSEDTLDKREGLNNVIVNAQTKQTFGDVLLLGGTPDPAGNAYQSRLSLAAAGDSGGPLLVDGKIIGVLSAGAKDNDGALSPYLNGRSAYNMYADVRGAVVAAVIRRAKGGSIDTGSGSASGTGTATGSSSGTGSTGCD
jgi:hypothetical protein